MKANDNSLDEKLDSLHKALFKDGEILQSDLSKPGFDRRSTSWTILNTRTKQVHYFDSREEAQEFYDAAIN